jgi:hypothetical protein
LQPSANYRFLFRLRIRARASTRFRCTFSAVALDDVILKYPPAFVPDIHNGVLFGDWISVGIQNLQDRWLNNLQLRINSPTISLHPDNYLVENYGIAPGQLLLWNFRIQLSDTFSHEGSSDECVKFNVEFLHLDKSLGASEIPLRCRTAGQVTNLYL